MGTVYTNFEQARIERESSKIISDLVSMGGVDWAINTITQIPSFNDSYQEKLRISLKEKLTQLNRHILSTISIHFVIDSIYSIKL